MIICSEEELYVLRLADVIADREELDLQVQVCTSFEQAERLEEFQGAELLLIGDEIPYEKRQMSRAARRFVLTSQEGTEVGEEEIPIYKYQSVRRIFAQIVETCLDQDNAGLFLVPRKGGRRLIVVYSPFTGLVRPGLQRPSAMCSPGKRGPSILICRSTPGRSSGLGERALLLRIFSIIPVRNRIILGFVLPPW